jgi:drug/metabolite transporter (DMT)-like permease
VGGARRRERRAAVISHLACLLGVAFWASSPTAIKFVLAEMPVWDAPALRFGLAAIVLWGVVLALGHIGEVRRIGWRPFVAGLVDPGIISIMAYQGFLLTAASHGTVIFALMPLVAALFGRVFLKEPLAAPTIAGAAIALVGVVLLVSSQDAAGSSSFAGDLLLVGCIVLICGAQVPLRRVATAHGRPLVTTAIMMSGAAATTIAARLVFGDNAAPLAWAETASTDTWIVFLYTALIISGSSFVLYNYALRHLPVARVSLYSVLQTPIGVPLAWAVLGERLSWVEVGAAALVIAGVAIPVIVSARARRAAAA